MSFQALFYPKSIAVIGASREEKTVGNDVVRNLLTQGYEGNVFLVNPKADQLYGQKVYADTLDIPSPIDLAVVAVPAAYVIETVQAAQKKGARAVIVLSAGFKEVGNEDLENELAQVCSKLQLTLVGPNCLGVMNPEIYMNASFAAVAPPQGNVAFVSQSGALCSAILDYAQDLGIGFSKFLSVGNKADVDELKLLSYFAQDSQTKVIALYAEQLENAPELIEAVRSIQQGENPKPVIILKSGKTKEGTEAVASHTGSLSGGDTAYTALFEQSGMIRAESIRELFDYLQIFSKNEFLPVNTVAVVTNAGGPGVITTDAVIESDLEMAELTPETVQALKSFLPSAASTHNPIDMLGDAQSDRYLKTLETVVNDNQVDALLVLLTPQSMTDVQETAQAIVQIKQKTNKPIAVSFLGRKAVAEGAMKIKEANIVMTPFPEQAAQALSALSQFSRQKSERDFSSFKFTDVDQRRVRSILDSATSEKRKTLLGKEAIDILQAYGFPFLRTAHAHSAPEAASVIREMVGEQGRCAMKIRSGDISHKSDVGGVMLNISSAQAPESFQKMMEQVKQNAPEAKIDGVTLMEMAPENGVEVIVGMSKAPGLGTLVMVGLGGIYVEVFKDVSFGFVPLTKHDSERMIQRLRASKILEGTRGNSPADTEKLQECLGRLSQLASDFPEIIELDINPLLVLSQGKGVVALDARIVLQ